MNKEQRWKKLDDKKQKLRWHANYFEALINRVSQNCRNMQSDLRYSWLLSLNRRGTHLADPVYQKLEDVYQNNEHYDWKSYLRDALARIGNRTMTQEEYELLEIVPKENLIGYKLDERLKDLEERITHIHGPFYCNRHPRTKKDPFNEGGR